MCEHKPRTLLVGCISVFFAVASAQAGQSQETTLPSFELVSAIEDLAERIDAENAGLEPSFLSMRVARAGAEAPVEEAFAEEHTMFLLFESSVSENELRDYIDSNDVLILEVFPEIGAIQIRANLNAFLESRPTDSDANDTLLRGLAEAVNEYQSDFRIRSAAPGLLLRSQHNQSNPQIDDVLPSTHLYEDIYETDPNDPNEVTDWGVADIEADRLWQLLGAQDGAIMGLLEAGFSRHEDLVFLELPPSSPRHNHGNHVAGIACAQHNDRGVRGVLPNCFVRAQPLDVFFSSGQGDEIGQFYVTFGQIIGALSAFLSSQDDVHAFNISLGYNWRPNFNINPDLSNSKSERARTLVEAQGAIVVRLLEIADRGDKVVFSAAGNDSGGLTNPVTAQYASPFNWAALNGRGLGLRNGVIVEAHDENGERAVFSNVGGDISCPGVNVVSSVAFANNNAPSASAYARTGGTSMASPYCAAGHVLFRMTRSSYTGVAAIDCMLQSSETSSSRTPMLRLMDARRVCP